MNFFKESKNFILESDSKITNTSNVKKYEWVNYNAIKGDLKAEKKKNKLLNINLIENEVLQQCTNDIDEYKNQLDVS